MKVTLGFVAVAVLSLLGPQRGDAAVPKFCSGCNFAGGNLAGSIFDDGTYVGVNFEGADLRGASFRGARLMAINFDGANLENGAFDGAQCTACNFSAAKLSGATFTKVTMLAANFKNFAARVDDAQLRSLLSGCVSCNFSGAELAGRDLSGATLLSVDLSGADLRGTRFDGAVLCWETIEGTKAQIGCDTMANAQTAGASFAEVMRCEDPIARRACTLVDAKTLIQKAGSPLQGAVLP